MKKRFLALTLTTALLVSMLAGCGDAANSGNDSTSTPDDSTSNTDVKEKRDVSLLITQSQNAEGLQEMIKKMENEEKIYTDAQVAPDDQFMKLMMMKFTNEEAPDLVGYNVPHIYNQLDPEEYFIDLSNEPWAERLINPSISLHTDGKIYGYTFFSSNGFQGVIYNKAVFENNGIEVPKTKEEFYAVCDTLKAAGITPMLVPGGTNWVPQIWSSSAFARAIGSKEAAEDMTAKLISGEKKFNDYPELAKAFDELLEIQDKGYLNEDISTLTIDDARVKLSQGETGMFMGAANIISKEAAMNPDVDLGIFNMPLNVDPNDMMSATLFSYGITGSKINGKDDFIKEIINLWASDEYADMYYLNAPAFPALEGVDGGKQDDDIEVLFNEHSENDTLVPEINLAWGVFDPLFRDYLWIYYDEALTKGTMDGAEVLDTFQVDVDKYLEANGFR